VIKIESAHIEEMRGIRNLDIDFRKERFAIWGPNGSGKSGVIDAIEFGLTGRIGRLAGKGTKGLTVAEHGPHVDKSKFPDAAFVRLVVYFPTLKKSATITRKVSSPKHAKIEPADSTIKKILADIADHPEITLTRRDLLRFILIEPTKRSEEIQALLKLDELGHTRGVLNTAKNRLQTASTSAQADVVAARTSLQQHLQIATFTSADLISAANQRRKLLHLPELIELTADTALDSGLTGPAAADAFNKTSAIQDIAVFDKLLAELPQLGTSAASTVVAQLHELESDQDLLWAFQSRSLIEKGLELLDGTECPLCDTEWHDEAQLRAHLQNKLDKSNAAKLLQETLLQQGAQLSHAIAKIIGAVGPVEKLANSLGVTALADAFAAWRGDLAYLRTNLSSVDGLLGLKSRLEKDWTRLPGSIPALVSDLHVSVNAKPDQTATIEAQTFLSTAQVRLSDYREASRKKKQADLAAEAAVLAYEAYCSVLEGALNTLYDEVQEDFSKFYRAINDDDESKFTAKFTPSEGQLGLEVNFYERGLYPPGAYHSEGHQDGMGVCLYLALMKRLFGEQFTLALLDDVVMSVDADHRRQFCKLLITHFPNTQFIITTHDRVWAEQMKNAKLVSGKTLLAFHGWTIDAGPLVASNEDVWQDIEASLNAGKVEKAAAALRNHLEYISRYLADVLVASVPYRSANNYEFGDLLPSVVSRLKELCGKAIDAAQSWGFDAPKQLALQIRAELSAALTETGMEQWAVNKAVHYNEWANFGKNDFAPVVSAFKRLLATFRCTKCSDWLHLSPRQMPESLRCTCGTINLSLKSKEK